ncbi:MULTISPECIES: Na(+)-translocating NADH-quinone reductase subunit A [Halocynthiibacter]|uniref:Na(+)-translocating NADH-quinone reductase subunit A n=1 Tax=Halocynthiibacter halioticoli TaxID=2986804 RepID=A0AAE3IZA1_9RHOB|nr:MULTISPECIES: Na(+)-translocating NADH-quinone reductase subunit A [Halocynthiibacter]MCV6824823.1 Na(+)-translocating NADH-quinone reductase subunit A [Halocynthiibacter halioticoli]MCW4057824.1 Na(+)-translocating NADH-quinone reductase subunit A [Halocynthiibacter sp. SDUM655004]
MVEFTLKKGLDLPVEGAPAKGITQGPKVTTVAVLGADYIGLKPRLAVEEGDVVACGAPIFAHKDTPDVKVTSPVSGRVRAVNRGARRMLISVEIEIDETAAEAVDFSSVGNETTADGIAERLALSGLWTSFRTRPYSKVPDVSERPAAIYVTAMDTEPLSADAAEIIADSPEAFTKGLAAVAQLSEGQTYLCHEKGADVPGADVPNVTAAAFAGVHPAGLAGTHMHFLEPPTATKTVWTIGYQDVIAIGRLMETGKLDSARVISLCGPLVSEPRLVRTVAGASMVELTQGGLESNVPYRLISGSILSGRAGSGPDAYLGRYARQLTVIEEDRKQIPMGWIRPMSSKYAFQPVLGSAFSKKLYALTSNLNGGRRAMVPLGTFEELMPQDYLPTQLLRAMLVMDTDTAQALGALELDEEDLGLVGFACPAKYEYGMALRDCLTKIEKEG